VNVKMTQELDAMQRMFLPAAISDTLRENARRFWENQDKILDSMENFANGWFERRHVGTRAALEAAQRMCKAQTPADLLHEYQNWASGTFERVMTDWSACQQQFIAELGVFAGASAPVVGRQEVEHSQPRTLARSKVA
jgi:hypothetical protein